MSRFIIESEKDAENMTDRYLRDIILNFMIAGKDTSANTLTWFFYMLCKHPLVQEKIFQEILEATKVEDAILPSIFAERLTQEALDKMHYLHATLTETLRLYPAVPVVNCLLKHFILVSENKDPSTIPHYSQFFF